MIINNVDCKVLKTFDNLGSGFCSNTMLFVQLKDKTYQAVHKSGSRYAFLKKDDVQSELDYALEALDEIKKALSVFDNTFKYEKTQDKTLNISGKDYQVIEKFYVYYQGWECDSKGYIVKETNSDKIQIALTNHGSLYISSLNEIKDFQDTYNEVKKEYEEMLALM